MTEESESMETETMTARGGKNASGTASALTQNAAVTGKPFTANPGNFHIHLSQCWRGLQREEPVSWLYRD